LWRTTAGLYMVSSRPHSVGRHNSELQTECALSSCCPCPRMSWRLGLNIGQEFLLVPRAVRVCSGMGHMMSRVRPKLQTTLIFLFQAFQLLSPRIMTQSFKKLAVHSSASNYRWQKLQADLRKHLLPSKRRKPKTQSQRSPRKNKEKNTSPQH